MGSYSLLDCLCSERFSKKSFSATLSTINSRLQYPGEKGLVLVEGKTDLIVLKQFFQYEFHMLGVSGKGNVLKVMENFDREDYPNLICILDADYKKVNTIDDRFFYYDYFDLESSLIRYDDIFKVFTEELGLSFKKLIRIRDKIINTLLPYECLRCVNYDLENYPSIPHFSCDELVANYYSYYLLGKRQFKKHILSKISILNPMIYCQSKVKTIISMYKSKYKALLADDSCKYMNGHDFVQTFIKDTGGKLSAEMSDDNENSIYCYFRDGLTTSVFRLTCLYSTIKDYEINHNIKIMS